MTYYRVVIATTEKAEGEELRKALEDTDRFQVVDVVDSGLACLRSAASNCAELIVMSLMLRDLDGLEVLGRLDQLFPVTAPKVMVVSCANVEQGNMALKAGASFSFLAPYAYRSAAKRAEELFEPAKVPFSDEEIDWTICRISQELSAPVQMEGFRHVRVGVELLLRYPQLIHRQITRKLYPAIASRCRSSGSKVERNLRNFIAALYTNGNMEGMAKYRLDILARSKSGNPSSSVFLIALAGQVLAALNQQQNSALTKGR